MTVKNEEQTKKPNPKLNVLPTNPETENSDNAISKGRFPSWLHRKLPKGEHIFQTNDILQKHRLNTVCEEAKCPNRLECYTKKTATFLALGKQCTRNCGFCDIDFSKNPKAPENDEPDRIAKSVKELGLKHVVITMVARDDLADQGAAGIANIVKEIRKQNPNVSIELLTSDFSGDSKALDIVLDTRPEIFNHNIETVEDLTVRVRHKATYKRTLQVLEYAKKSKKVPLIKSGLMLGLGETPDQIKATIRDLHSINCDIITLGQYLQANRKKLRVKEFITPETFQSYAKYGHNIGVPHVYAGPFVRSSYNAGDIFDLLQKQNLLL